MLQLQCQWPCTLKYWSKHSLDLCLQINKWWPAEGCSLQLQPPWRLRRTSSYARGNLREHAFAALAPGRCRGRGRRRPSPPPWTTRWWPGAASSPSWARLPSSRRRGRCSNTTFTRRRSWPSCHLLWIIDYIHTHFSTTSLYLKWSC